jgi:hypothetical protein
VCEVLGELALAHAAGTRNDSRTVEVEGGGDLGEEGGARLEEGVAAVEVVLGCHRHKNSLTGGFAPWVILFLFVR